MPFSVIPQLSPSRLCRAWISFDGTTLTILASFNIAGILRTQPAGEYQINFVTPFDDANFVSIGNAARGGALATITRIVAPAVGSIKIQTIVPTTGGLVDANLIGAAFYHA